MEKNVKDSKVPNNLQWSKFSWLVALLPQKRLKIGSISVQKQIIKYYNKTNL